jgi:hypothetical protein
MKQNFTPAPLKLVNSVKSAVTRQEYFCLDFMILPQFYIGSFVVRIDPCFDTYFWTSEIVQYLIFEYSKSG